MIRKTAIESLPHNCGTPNCNYKRLKNREYYRADIAGKHLVPESDPGYVLFLPTRSRQRRFDRANNARAVLA